MDTDRDAPVSFPRLAARTQRFTLGEPRSITVTPDGSRVLFIRTASGTDRTGALWEFDVDSGNERVLADPAALLDGGEELSAAERARRERARETGAGVVSYTVDDAGRNAAFALSGGVWVYDLVTGRVDELPRVDGVGAAIDPRIDPTGHQVAYTADGALRLVGVDGTGDRALVESDGPGVVWGQAEFVAAEEMDRFRGFWWAPDGSGLLVERYDETPVPVWHLADPADPGAGPVAHRYPVAGSDDALVQLWHLTVDGDRWQVPWDEVTFPYLTRVSWTGRGDPVVQVMSRDQRTAAVIRVDTAARTTITVAEISDPVWVELVSGVPACAADGRLLTTVDDVDSDTRRLAVDGVPFSPAGLQIREVLDVDDDGALVRASTEDPTVVRLLLVRWDGRVTELSTGAGVHGGARVGGTTVVASARMDTDGVEVAVSRDDERRGTLARQGISPPVKPQVELLRTGPHDVATAVLFPSGHTSGTGRLPVLMAPYGGPHGQLVQQHRRGFLQAQYLADQGFCVVVADGRGTPGRGPHWEKAVRDEFASVTLQDQVDALDGVAARYPGDVDTDRVGILGWSYGGYLSALAVLERPDVFRAAVAGAPVTDWRLYDTFYTERYLGHPDEQPDVYLRNSLLDTASVPFVPTAEVPEPPQLLILHGMVDDNVVVAHTLRLSSALLAAGRPHAVLPLTGVTHMTPQEVVAENLLFLQVDFLRRALGAVSAG